MCGTKQLMPVKFYQFILPDGRVNTIHIERPQPIAELAGEIWGFGWQLEAEILRTGEVSLAIESHDEELGTVAHRVVPNTPNIPNVVDEIIVKAHARMKAHIEATRE